MFHHFSFSLPLLSLFLLLPTLALSITLQIASLPSCLEPSPITVSWTPAASGVTFKVVDVESTNLISHQGSGQLDASKEVSSFVWTPWTPTAEEEQDKKEYILTLLVKSEDGSQDSFASNDFIVLKDCGGGRSSTTGTSTMSTGGSSTAGSLVQTTAQTTLNGEGEAAASTRARKSSGGTGSTATATGNYTMTKSTDARNGFEKGWDDFTDFFTGDNSGGASIEVPWLGIWLGVLVGLGSGMGVLWGR